jgi:hypothetical protein
LADVHLLRSKNKSRMLLHASRDPMALGWYTVEHRSLASDVCRRST